MTPTFKNLDLSRQQNIFIITLQKPPENRLNSSFCQEIIKAFRYVEKTLGPGSEGAVITRGNDFKFYCTGVDLEELDDNIHANSDGFYPLLAMLLDFPFPTIAMITGHTVRMECFVCGREERK